MGGGLVWFFFDLAHFLFVLFFTELFVGFGNINKTCQGINVSAN